MDEEDKEQDNRGEGFGCCLTFVLSLLVVVVCGGAVLFTAYAFLSALWAFLDAVLGGR